MLFARRGASTSSVPYLLLGCFLTTLYAAVALHGLPLEPFVHMPFHPSISARLAQFVFVFVCFFLLPFLFARLLGDRPRDLGFAFSSARIGAVFVSVGLLAAVPALYFTTMRPDFQAEYPLAKEALQDWATLAYYEASYLLYYVGWESFFRGFLLFGLRPSLGDFPAIAFETLGSTLLHIGKPLPELWASLVAGFLFGYVALRTRTFLWVLLLHYAVGVLTDLFCAYHQGLLPSL